MEPGEISRRLSRSAHGSDRGKSRSRWKRNRRKTKENAQTNEGDRSGFRSAKKSGGNGREEESDSQIARETKAACEESGVTVAAVCEPPPTARALKLFERRAATPRDFENSLTTP